MSVKFRRRRKEKCLTNEYFVWSFERKIHYLTREFRVKLHAKTDIARIAKRQKVKSQKQASLFYKNLRDAEYRLQARE